MLDYIPKDTLPQVCLDCEERKECLAQGAGEACCDECDHLMERFIVVGEEELEQKWKVYRLRRALRAFGIDI